MQIADKIGQRVRIKTGAVGIIPANPGDQDLIVFRNEI